MGLMEVVAGGLGSIGSDVLNYNLNRHQSDKMWRRQEKAAAKVHQTEVRDLIAAGLNPILSANAGANTPSYNEAAQADFDLNSSIQTAKMLADTKLTEAQARTQNVLTEIEKDKKVVTGIDAKRAAQADQKYEGKPGQALAYRVGDKTAAGQAIHMGGAAVDWIQNALQPYNSAFKAAEKRYLDKPGIKKSPVFLPKSSESPNDYMGY